MGSYFDIEKQPQATQLLLKGAWQVGDVSALEKQLKEAALDAQTLHIEGAKLTGLDTSGAWVLVKFIRGAQQKNINVVLNNFQDSHRTIVDIVSKIEHPANAEAAQHYGIFARPFITVGKHADAFMRSLADLITFFGILCVTIGKTIADPRRLRVRSVVAHINEIAINAVPIIALMAFLISIVLGYQGANQLQNFGATIFTIDLVAISVLREMGVLITAIMVAGRSGSAFAAQIGVMQVNEEVDAMRTIGLDPFELLVLPRILAILIALPALTLIADIVGLAGTWFVASMLVDVSTLQFLTRLQSAVDLSTFWVGLVKAPVFALLIGMVGCLHGLQVERSAAQVGTRTTMAVVQAIFLVILADALFSVLFTALGI